MEEGIMTHVFENHDKFLGVREENVEEFEWKCAYCSSNKLLFHPVGISYRPHTIHDFTDLPVRVAGYYQRLPNIVEATLRCVEGERNTSFLVECIDCHNIVRGLYNSRPNPTIHRRLRINKVVLRKYLNKIHGIDDDTMFRERLTVYVGADRYLKGDEDVVFA